LAGAPLDSRITFTRGSNATLVDSRGRITYAPANLVLQSQTFDNASWNKTVGTFGGTIPVVTPNVAEAPDGTMTADRAQFATGGTANSDDLSTLVQIPAGAGTPALFSVWVKSNTTSDQVLLLRVGSTFTAITATPSWQRFSALQSTPVTSYAVNIGLRGSVTGTVSSADVLLWGAQLEPVTYQTTAGPYVATTTAAYYGPRFDYDPVTLAPKGILIEEQRVNLLLRSEEFDNASWTKLRATVTANATTSPDGTADAEKLVEDTTASDTHFVLQLTAVSSSTSYTYSVFLKAAERTRAALVDGGGSSSTGVFDLSNGTVVSASGCTAAITNFGNGWYRCTITFTTGGAQTMANCRVFLVDTGTNITYTGNGTSGLFLWGAQLEAGAFPTSYIPTVASQVTRSADNASMTGTNFSSWYNQPQGTFVASYSRIQTTDAFAILLEVKPTSNNTNDRINISVQSTADPRVQVFIEGTSKLDTGTTFGPVALGAVVNIGVAYQSGNIAAVRNGSTPITSASTFTTPSYTNMQIGGTDNGIFGPVANSPLNGHIRQIAFYNTRLSNATLVSLTA
jgi:hypothetical protein